MTDILFDFISLQNTVILLIFWAINSFYFKMKFESWTTDKITNMEDRIINLNAELSDLKISHNYTRKLVENVDNKHKETQ